MDAEELKIIEMMEGRPTTLVMKAKLLDNGDNKYGLVKIVLYDLGGYCSIYAFPQKELKNLLGIS